MHGQDLARRRMQDGDIVITGGAGFIGANLAAGLAGRGEQVQVVDTLRRPESQRNADWLARTFGACVRIVRVDVRDPVAVQKAVRNARTVYHLATCERPAGTADVDLNTCGTSNVIDALADLAEPPALLIASTTKVYGRLATAPVQRLGSRYLPVDMSLRESGIDEQCSTDAYGPAGAWVHTEQNALERACRAGLPATVFRIGCTYGPRQALDGEAGWVAHLMRRILARRPLVVSADGRQVRDFLYVQDLTEAMDLWRRHAAECAGRAFNIGGGRRNAVSILELIDVLSHMFGITARPTFRGWTGEEPLFWVTNSESFAAVTGWRPRTRLMGGLRHLHEWIRESARAERGAWVESAIAG